VKRFIKLRDEVTSCNFNKTEGKWHISVKTSDGQVINDTSDVLISARGGLNHIAWPEIDGLRSFEGEIMHSAKWNDE
jgi:cation diffusion facilitator CzcD-associated flavoprotein CzcO